MSGSTLATPRGVQQRWMGVGQSGEPDAHAAGASAAREALAAGSDAKLLVVFCSQAYDLEALLAGIRSESGDVPLIGCSTAGEIATDGPGESGVVVTALGGDGLAVQAAASEDASGRLREASGEVAASMASIGSNEHRALLLLTDGLGGDQEEVVRGAYSVVGAGVPLVGGCAGDDLQMQQTYQLFNDRVLTNAIVGASLGSDSPMGIGVRHGWQKVGEPMMVSRSEDNRVYELDDRPALDAYLERLNAPEAAHTDPAAFTQFAMTHPLGVSRRSGEEVRFIADADFDDRSIGCIARVPEGGLAWIMEGDDSSVLQATDAACRDALEPLGDIAPIGILAFDCIARRGVLGEEGIRSEISRIAENAGGAPVAGFYTYGEIARTRGMNGFHNQTLVVLAIT